MYLDELVAITEKLRSVKIGDEAAQNYVGAAVINLDHAIERVHKAAQPSVQRTECMECGADLVLSGVKYPSGDFYCAVCGTRN